MKIVFEADAAVDRRTAKIVTHPEERARWEPIREAIEQGGAKIGLINAANDRIVQVPLASIAVIESEDRMCSVRLANGERYLLNKRLKVVETELNASPLLRINNRTIVNADHIREFSAARHARIEVTLTDGSQYLVSRFYIKNFRGKFQ